MTDLRKFGPLGEGGESQPAKVDLTRIDIRRGTLYLPRRFYGALPEGELEASDTVAGRAISVRFQPPRQLEGLGPFYEEHGLRPNDAVALLLTDVLQLTAVRRERRQSSDRAQSEAASDTARDRQVQPVAPASLAAVPPPPDIKAGWQDVLHDPIPRRHPAGTSGPAGEGRGFGRGRQEEPEGPSWEPEASAHVEQRPPEARVQQVERTRRESGPESRTAASGDVEKPKETTGESRFRPLAPEADSARRQQGLFDQRAAEKVARVAPQADRELPLSERVLPQSEPAPQSAPVAPKSERVTPRAERVPRDEPAETEREPVAVGAPAQQDAAGRIAGYLRDPRTPAIVRASAVAEELRLPLETVQRGLAEVSSTSEGAVSPIRPDVYLVKRSG